MSIPVLVVLIIVLSISTIMLFIAWMDSLKDYYELNELLNKILCTPTKSPTQLSPVIYDAKTTALIRLAVDKSSSQEEARSAAMQAVKQIYKGFK